MRHQELLFSPSVFGAAIALNDCHHPRDMRLARRIYHRDRQQKHGPSTLGLSGHAGDHPYFDADPSDETRQVREESVRLL
jgi:hypothetical protein